MDILNISDETSYLSVKPDLNKCINLFYNEHLNKEYESFEEQLNTALCETTVRDIDTCHLSKNKTVKQWDFNNRPRSMSADSLRNIILFNQELRRAKSYTLFNRNLKRDTNYNIKADQFLFPTKIATKINCNEKVETIVPSFDALSLSKSFPSKKYDTAYSMEDQRHDSINSERSSKEELNPSELKIFLYSLADQKPLKEAAGQQRLLRRLSTNYYGSPQTFTEGLLTIIEESVIKNDSCAPLQYPEVSLCRFNEELQKMCKFIEDETVPEWPQSPGMSTSICAKRKSQESKLDLLRKSLGAFTAPDKGLYVTTPVSSRRNIKSPKKICRRMSKNTSYTAQNLLHDSTNTFECLEAYCEKLYPDEYKSSVREKNRLQFPLQNMDNIWRVCESQMASLQDSPNIQEQIKKVRTCTPNSANQHNKTPKAQNLHRLLSREKYEKTDSKRVSDILKQRTECNKRQEMIELDELESTLMYEIAKKRQRCLDTAKIMMEIDAESTEAQETYSNIISSDSSPIRNDDKFMETLMCVKKYQDYLEKNKPLLDLFHRVKSYSPRIPRDRKDVQTKKMSNENFGTCAVLSGNKSTLRTPKLSPRKKSKSPSSAKHCLTNKTGVSKPRLFVTPGKTPVNKICKSKRTYFPNMLPGTNKQNEPSPHAKKIYRQIGSYDHVISPVGMYIKGTEPKLKNVRPKTDGMLSIPKRKQTTRSPSPKMMFRPSPKRSKEVNGINQDINIICKTSVILLEIYLALYYFRS